MEIETPNTKTALILAAGPHFAEKGEIFFEVVVLVDCFV